LTTLVDQVLSGCGHDEQQKTTVLDTLNQFYNGYRFCYETDQSLLYNPTLCFYFLRHYQRGCQPPREILAHLSNCARASH
jgi:hypothetical protein